MSVNANEKMLADNADTDASYLMLIPMLLYLNTYYDDADADLCIKIMYLCCKSMDPEE